MGSRSRLKAEEGARSAEVIRVLYLFRGAGQSREESALVTRRFGASEKESTPTAQAYKTRVRDLHLLDQLKLNPLDTVRKESV